MRELLVLVVAVGHAGCLQIGTGNRGGDAGNLAPSTSATSHDAGPSGTNCLQDPSSQTVLCERIDTCPGVRVDPGAFPDCGFRLHSGVALDLECLCGSALCPLGAPTSCDQAAQLLLAQSALVVCQQRAEGRCVELAASDAGAGTCDRACESQCAGAPPCIQLCGC